MGRRHSQFKTILVAYDGSAQSDKATEKGLALAHLLDSKVTIMCRSNPGGRQQMNEVFPFSGDVIRRGQGGKSD
jgi:nucleotide-binding universal stress UspA family protein